jgi:hypothetical protein
MRNATERMYPFLASRDPNFALLSEIARKVVVTGAQNIELGGGGERVCSWSSRSGGDEILGGEGAPTSCPAESGAGQEAARGRACTDGQLMQRQIGEAAGV